MITPSYWSCRRGGCPGDGSCTRIAGNGERGYLTDARAVVSFEVERRTD